MNSKQSGLILEPLRKWFLNSKRPLPWRENRDPYSVFVSEMMLQQTQVSVVIPYYHRWMERFPTFEALAESREEEVLKCWEGLGYYSRARSLHKASRHVCDHFGGEMPSDENLLQEIPGIGPYTVGAIRSFAFRQKGAAIDGNVIRVISRLHALQENVDTVKGKREVKSLVDRLLPDEEPWVVSEALIELGALVCKKIPLCAQCPLKKVCKAFKENLAGSIPVKKSKIPITPLFRAVPVLVAEGHVLIRKVPEGEIMGGLYEFPYFETDKEGMEGEDLQKAVQKKLGLASQLIRPLSVVQHGFTRYKVRLTPFLLECAPGKAKDGYFFAKLGDLSTFPFSSGHRRVLKLLSYSLMYL